MVPDMLRQAATHTTCKLLWGSGVSCEVGRKWLCTWMLHGCLSLVSMDIIMPGPHDKYIFFLFFPQRGYALCTYTHFFTSESPILAVTVEKTGVDQTLMFSESNKSSQCVYHRIIESTNCLSWKGTVEATNPTPLY